MTSIPSGEQYCIEYGPHRAHITEVGATLRSYCHDGVDVIDGFSVDQRAADGRGQVLAPWPNRLSGGAYRYGGRSCQAPINELSRQTAIHGLVRWLNWSVTSLDDESVTLSCALRPQPGYEWALDLEVGYTIGADGLTVNLRAVGSDRTRLPFGAGFHPYLTLGTTTVDRLQLTVPADCYLDLAPAVHGTSALPVPVQGTPLDFRTPRQVGAAVLDTAFGNLLRGSDGRATALLTDPADGRTVRLWVDEAYRYLMVYTADHVTDADRRRRAIAIEPMTCPPEALRTGTDLVELVDGEVWRGSWGVQPGPA